MLSENQIINLLKIKFPNAANNKWIGDDAATIRIDDEKVLVTSTDSLVEGVHFTEKIPAYDIGYKSVIVNLSDIASMGVKPNYILVALSIPRELNELWIRDFIDGVADAAKKYDVEVVGGDTTASISGIYVNVSAFSIVSKDNIKPRFNAKIGDIICVAGSLGESKAGLELLGKDQYPRLRKAHITPDARIKEGAFLGQYKSVTSMMDVSDGLYEDIQKFLPESLGANISLENLHIENDLKDFCELKGYNIFDFVLSGGEDYALLFTVDPDFFVELSERFYMTFGYNICNIGVVNNSGKIEYFLNDKVYIPHSSNFKHFL